MDRQDPYPIVEEAFVEDLELRQCSHLFFLCGLRALQLPGFPTAESVAPHNVLAFSNMHSTLFFASEDGFSWATSSHLHSLFLTWKDDMDKDSLNWPSFSHLQHTIQHEQTFSLTLSKYGSVLKLIVTEQSEIPSCLCIIQSRSVTFISDIGQFMALTKTDRQSNAILLPLNVSIKDAIVIRGDSKSSLWIILITEQGHLYRGSFGTSLQDSIPFERVGELSDLTCLSTVPTLSTHFVIGDKLGRLICFDWKGSALCEPIKSGIDHELSQVQVLNDNSIFLSYSNPSSESHLFILKCDNVADLLKGNSSSKMILESLFDPTHAPTDEGSTPQYIVRSLLSAWGSYRHLFLMGASFSSDIGVLGVPSRSPQSIQSLGLLEDEGNIILPFSDDPLSLKPYWQPPSKTSSPQEAASTYPIGMALDFTNAHPYRPSQSDPDDPPLPPPPLLWILNNAGWLFLYQLIQKDCKEPHSHITYWKNRMGTKAAVPVKESSMPSSLSPFPVRSVVQVSSSPSPTPSPFSLLSQVTTTPKEPVSPGILKSSSISTTSIPTVTSPPLREPLLQAPTPPFLSKLIPPVLDAKPLIQAVTSTAPKSTPNKVLEVTNAFVTASQFQKPLGIPKGIQDESKDGINEGGSVNIADETIANYLLPLTESNTPYYSSLQAITKEIFHWKRAVEKLSGDILGLGSSLATSASLKVELDWLESVWGGASNKSRGGGGGGGGGGGTGINLGEAEKARILSATSCLSLQLSEIQNHLIQGTLLPIFGMKEQLQSKEKGTGSSFAADPQTSTILQSQHKFIKRQLQRMESMIEELQYKLNTLSMKKEEPAEPSSSPEPSMISLMKSIEKLDLKTDKMKTYIDGLSTAMGELEKTSPRTMAEKKKKLEEEDRRRQKKASRGFTFGVTQGDLVFDDRDEEYFVLSGKNQENEYIGEEGLLSPSDLNTMKKEWKTLESMIQPKLDRLTKSPARSPMRRGTPESSVTPTKSPLTIKGKTPTKSPLTVKDKGSQADDLQFGGAGKALVDLDGKDEEYAILVQGIKQNMAEGRLMLPVRQKEKEWISVSSTTNIMPPMDKADWKNRNIFPTCFCLTAQTKEIETAELEEEQSSPPIPPALSPPLQLGINRSPIGTSVTLPPSSFISSLSATPSQVGDVAAKSDRPMDAMDRKSPIFGMNVDASSLLTPSLTFLSKPTEEKPIKIEILSASKKETTMGTSDIAGVYSTEAITPLKQTAATSPIVEEPPIASPTKESTAPSLFYSVKEKDEMTQPVISKAEVGDSMEGHQVGEFDMSMSKEQLLSGNLDSLSFFPQDTSPTKAADHLQQPLNPFLSHVKPELTSSNSMDFLMGENTDGENLFVKTADMLSHPAESPFSFAKGPPPSSSSFGLASPVSAFSTPLSGGAPSHTQSVLSSPTFGQPAFGQPSFGQTSFLSPSSSSMMKPAMTPSWPSSGGGFAAFASKTTTISTPQGAQTAQPAPSLFGALASSTTERPSLTFGFGSSSPTPPSSAFLSQTTTSSPTPTSPFFPNPQSPSSNPFGTPKPPSGTSFTHFR